MGHSLSARGRTLPYPFSSCGSPAREAYSPLPRMGGLRGFPTLPKGSRALWPDPVSWAAGMG